MRPWVRANDEEGEMSVLLTGEMLADWAERALSAKARYWYGTCWYPATGDLLARKRKQYPAHYAPGRTAAYERDIAAGRMVCDCVGLIKGFFWTGNGAGANRYKANNCPDVSANGLFALCRETGGMGALPETPGVVLWKSGHVGVYVGGGQAIEARSFADGVVRTKVNGRGWQKWGYLPDSMLGYGGQPLPAAPLLRRGMCGDAVERMQALLTKWNRAALPIWGVDGQFGAETRSWVLRFQRACGIAADGIVGPVTWGRLRGRL